MFPITRSNNLNLTIQTGTPPAQPQREWSGVTASNLRRASIYHLREPNSFTVAMTDIPGALARLQQCLRVMNVEGHFHNDGHADLRMSKGGTFHIATWAPRDNTSNDATIELQRTSSDGMAFYEGIRGLRETLSGDQTLQWLENSHNSQPLNETSANGIMRFNSALHAMMSQQTVHLSAALRFVETEDSHAERLYAQIQTPYGNDLESLPLYLDPSKMTASSVVDIAERIVGQSDAPINRGLRSAVVSEIIGYANGMESLASANQNTGRLRLQGSIRPALDALNKALEANAFLSQPIRGSAATLNDELKSDELLSALVKIAGQPRDQQNLSALAFNSLKMLMRDETTNMRIRAFPTFEPTIASARAFIETEFSTVELERAVDRIAE